MRAKRDLRGIGLLLAILVASALPPTHAAAPEKDEIINQLGRFDTAPDLDIAALRQKVIERSKSRSRSEPEPSKRPQIVPELVGLPTFTVDIRFDTDTPVVRPESYQTVGRIADALVNAALLPYNFLVVGHTDSNGRREANVLLSQRRADALRDVLVNTFKISSQRIQSLRLGEEQFIDQSHPTSPVNQQIQILTIAKVPEQSEQPPQAATPSSAAKKKSAKKR